MFNLKMLRTLVSVGISNDNPKDPLNASLDIIRKKAFIKKIFLKKKKKKKISLNGLIQKKGMEFPGELNK